MMVRSESQCIDETEIHLDHRSSEKWERDQGHLTKFTSGRAVVFVFGISLRSQFIAMHFTNEQPRYLWIKGRRRPDVAGRVHLPSTAERQY
jgi:hypothetical protein